MELFPAIDLKDGKVVRLTQGDYDRVQVFAEDPAQVAQSFVEKGAKNLHVVDLDGARDGKLSNLAAIRAILEVGGLYVEVGGGIRDEDRIARYLDLGVGRAILGTVAVERFGFTREMIGKYGDKIAVGVDAREGKVATRGWIKDSGEDSIAFCRRLNDAGVATIIYTDIARDGAMAGTNLAVYRQLVQEVSCDIVASGGISSGEELTQLKAIGVRGAILGKALYTGALDLQEVLALC